MWWDWRKFLW